MINQRTLKNHRVADKATVTAITNGNDKTYTYCDENSTIYRYVTAGAAFTVDGEAVLATADGGDTRWVGNGMWKRVGTTISPAVDGDGVQIYDAIIDVLAGVDNTIVVSDVDGKLVATAALLTDAPPGGSILNLDEYIEDPNINDLNDGDVWVVPIDATSKHLKYWKDGDKWSTVLTKE